MPGRAVPSIRPAQKLVGTARMITKTEMEVSRRRMSMRNSRGKQPTGEEPSPKRRKMGGSSHQEKRPASIGAPTQHRRRQVVVSSSSDDDGSVAPPSPRVGTPPLAVPVGAEMREMPRMRETIVVTPHSVWVTSMATTRVALAATARVAARVPETTVTPPVEVARVTTIVPETTRAVPVVAVRPQLHPLSKPHG